MNDLVTRIRVLVTSVIAALSALLAILVVISQQLENFPNVPDWITKLVGAAIAVIGVTILQVRRVTPVDDSQKGLLPPKGPATPTIDATGEVHRPD